METMDSLKKIYKSFFKNNIFTYITLVICLFLYECGILFLYNHLGKLIDYVIYNKVEEINILGEIILILCLLFILIVLGLLHKHIDFSLSNQGLIYVERAILDNIIHTEYELVMNYDKIQLAQQINNDCVIVMDYQVSQRPTYWVTLLKLGIIMGLIGFYSIPASLALFVCSILFIFLYVVAQRRYENLNKEMIDSQSQYFRVLGGELLNIFLVKINSWYARTIKRFSCSGNIFVKKSVRFLDFDFFLTNFTKILSLACTFGLPLLLILLSPNNITGIFSIVALTQLYFPALEIVVGQFKKRSRCHVAQRRLDSLITLSKEPWGNQTTQKIRKISIENVTFKYNRSPKNILQDFSYCFYSNHIYLLMGDNGSGKSTFLNLLLGLLEPSSGAIQINGDALRKYNLDVLRAEKISYCEQEPYLIPGSILDNLSYGLSPNSADFSYSLLEFVQHMPNGLSTEISTGSHNLSGGQKQRIALSRCFAKTCADVMIFDEPTSALDKQGICDFIHMLQVYKKGRIIIVVTHDPDLISIADDVIRLS